MTRITAEYVARLAENLKNRYLEELESDWYAHMPYGRDQLSERERALAAEIARCNEARRTGAFSDVETELRRVYGERLLLPEPGTPDWYRLADGTAAARTAALESAACRCRGDFSGALPAVPASVPVGSPELVGDLVDRFASECAAHGHWRRGTVEDNLPKLALFVEAVGDVPACSLCMDHVEAFKDVLFHIPSNRRKLKRYRGLTLSQLMAAEVPEKDRLRPNSRKNYTSVVAVFLKWLHDNGKTVVSGLDRALDRHIDTDGPEVRGAEPFTPTELAAIFDELGRRQERFRFPWQFWAPLIGCLSGMRLEEICQLRVEDIVRVQETDGDADDVVMTRTWCFKIRRVDGRTAKNGWSERLVPVHPVLIRDLGFLAFVRELKGRGETYLFPDRLPGKARPKQQFSAYPSRWFTTLLKKAGVKDERPGMERTKCFHSFRDTFFDVLRKKPGVSTDVIREIVGHCGEQRDTASRHYFKPYCPAVRRETVERFAVPGLDLSKLKGSKFCGRRKGDEEDEF